MIKIYPIVNNINFGRTDIDPKVAFEFEEATRKAKSELNTVKKDPELNSLRKRVTNAKGEATPEEIARLQAKHDTIINEVKKPLTDAANEFKANAHAPKDTVPKPILKLFQKWSNSGLMKYLSKKGPRGIALALAAGNVGKELVGTTVYTVQALTNEDLPADKRKFIGMYDLMVGLISTSFSALFGFGAVAAQDKLLEKALRKNSGAGYPKYAAAFTGLVWLIPQLLQTIIGKRIVAPAIAIPLAGKMKENMIAKAKNQQIATEDKLELSNKIEKEPELNFTNSGFVDLKSYVANLKEQKA